jgi:hypothetical protein
MFTVNPYVEVEDEEETGILISLDLSDQERTALSR